MAAKKKSDDADFVARIARAARGSLAAPQAELAEAFARLYYAGADLTELAERDVNDLMGAALAHVNFGRRFAGGAARVRVFNPKLEEHGWQSTHTAVQIVSGDMPFLVDSTTMAINRLGLALHLVVHPVLRVMRDAKGMLQGVAAPAAAGDGRLE